MTFTMDDILEVLKIVKACDDGELHIETGDIKLSVIKGDSVNGAAHPPGFTRENSVAPPAQPAAAPVAAPATAREEPQMSAVAEPSPVPVTAPAGEVTIPEGLVPIRATVTSVFYRKPSPVEEPFVEVGSEIEEESVVCLLDVMKCYYSVVAGVRGRIEKILVESGQLVESGAILFLVKPA